MNLLESLDQCGEAGLLSRLAAHFPQTMPMVVGPGDDSAVADVNGQLVMSTDSIVENIDFIVGISSGEDVGRKLAVQNLADVAAMGARPKWLLYTAMMPGSTSVSLFEDIARGIGFEAHKHRAAVVGGDLGTARDITLSITAVGLLPSGAEPVRRSGAVEGDLVVLGTPVLGLSAAGLAQVLAEADGNIPDMAAAGPMAHRAKRWHCAPDTDLSLGYRYGHLFSSMIDVSDGLVRDGRRIAQASNVCLDLDSAVLASDLESLAPLAACFDADPWEWVLGSGEEHAMLATVSSEQWQSHPELHDAFRVIGRVVAADPTARGSRALDGASCPADGVLLDGQGVMMRGFDHFER